MTKIDPAVDPAARAPAVGTSLAAVFARLVLGMVVIGAITAAGLAIYRNQRPVKGLPVAIAVAPTPRASASAAVEDDVTRFQKQIATAPDDAEGWRNLGWSYFQREQFAQSADALRHATALDPTDARTLSFLGEALLQAHLQQHRALARMPYAARAAFDEALKLDPTDARARYYRAVGWDLAGQHRRAIHAWFALLAATPPDAPYAADIRAVIRTVGARHHISVEQRLADVQYVAPGAAPGAAPAPGSGRAKVPGPTGERMRAALDVPRPAASDAAQNH